MKHLKRKDGFTLVELVVGIAAASLVLAAASSLLLMGARIQRTLRDEAQEQQTSRIVLTMLEDLVAEGQIKSINTTSEGWELKDGESDESATILAFDNSKGQLLGAGDSVLLDGLKTAHADLHGNLFTFDFETAKNSYATSVYCRLIQNVDESTSENIKPIKDKFKSETPGDVIKDDSLSPTVKNARYKFLQTLCKEYGSTGAISNRTAEDVEKNYKYYSEWYCKGYKDGWNSSTPWCACFLSWAIDQNKGNITGEIPRFANVNTGWNDGPFKVRLPKGSIPTPGDYIFFDWECDNDPDHVGAVLFVHDNTVYTIEGNSGGRVAIHSYNIRDPRIYGYGVLNWVS